MRVAGIAALGESVEIFEVDEPAMRAVDDVLIDIVTAGIGNWDELVRIGSWQIGGPAPMALGTEAAGTVAAAGSGVAELSEGDAVMTHPLPRRLACARSRDQGRNQSFAFAQATILSLAQPGATSACWLPSLDVRTGRL